MKKASKPSVVTKPAPIQPAAKPLAAKSNKGISIPLKTPPKTTAKSPSKPKPKEAQGQAELLPIIERLAQAAERLAQAAERLAEAAARTSATTGTEQPQRQDEMPEQAGEVIGVMALDETEKE